MNELIKQNEGVIKYTPEQVNLIKSLIAPKANNNELQLFLYQCQRTGLDPLTRQIYAIHRWANGGEKMTIQTSIDGFRVIAERSGVYGGQSEPEFIEADGKLECCKVRVYKFNNGTRYEAAVGVAYWSEYVQLGKDGKPMGLWLKMPHTMLSKVAEALALRKAFPQDLSGLYTGDEMNQSDAPEISDVPTKEERYLLTKLLMSSDLEGEDYDKVAEAINTCTDFKKYEKIQHGLESRQKSIHQIVNPTPTDVNKHLKATVQ